MIRLLAVFIILAMPAFLHSVIVEYKWPDSAPQYHIIISTNSSFYFPSADDMINATNYIIDLSPGHYYLKIAPVLKGIEGLFSEPVEFDVSDDDNGGIGKLSGVKSPASTEEELSISPTIMRWNCNISSRNPLNLNSVLYYSLDTPSGFIKNRGLQIKVETATLEEGFHTLFYRLINPIGNEGRISSVRFVVERTPPSLEIEPEKFIVFGDKTYLYPGSVIGFSCRDKWLPYNCYFGVNQKKVAGQFYTVTKDTNVLKCLSFARNSLNYESRLVKTFYVDTDPPVIKLYLNKKEVIKTSSASGDNILNLNITDNTRVSQFVTVFDDATNTNMPSSWRFLKPGLHTLEITATDMFDNISSHTWEIDISENKSVITWIVFPAPGQETREHGGYYEN